MMNSFATPAPTRAQRRIRRRLMTGGAVGLAIGALMLAPQARAQVSVPGGSAFQGTPQVVSGGASIVQTPTIDTIRVTTPQAVINWTPSDRNGTGPIDFLPNGLRGQFIGDTDFTVLNRIIPLNGQDVPVARIVALNGQITSSIGPSGQPGGSVWFYSPGGILVGDTAIINVGSLLLTSREIDTTGGLFGSSGEIRFRDPALAGAAGAVEIAPGAQINARAAVTGSSYVAIVAPSIVQAGTIRADGSVALVAAEQADIRINQGLFDINVLVGTDDPHGIIHTGFTGGPSDTSGTYDSRAYLVAVPKNQAITMLLSGTIGFETASSVSIAANGGIVLSAGHNIVGGIAGPRAPGTGAGNMSITDSSFRNNLDATASGSITARPNQACQPFCDDSPSGQLLFNGNATFNGATGVSLSIGQAQQIIVNGNLSLLSATPGQGGSASLTIDNVSPPSSSSGSGIASITGALLLDASARGNPATESGAASGGTAALSVNNGLLNAASISVRADAIGVVGGSTTGGSGTGGTARLSVENGGSVSTPSLIQITADGFGAGSGIDATQNPLFAATGGNGRGGTASIIVDNARLSADPVVMTANGYGAAGTITSGDGFGGTASVSVDNNGGSTLLSSSFVQITARGEGGGIGFDRSGSNFLTTADGGDGLGGTASLSISDTTPRDVAIGSVLLDAGAFGGNSQASSTGPGTALGGIARGGTATASITGATSAVTIEQLTVIAEASGGNAVGLRGRGGDATGGTTQVTLDGGATLTNSNAQSTFGGSYVRADGLGGIGEDVSGAGIGGAAGLTLSSGAQIEGDQVILTANGIGGGADVGRQSFTPVTTIGGSGRGGTVLLNTGGTIASGLIRLDAYGFGADSNPASNAVSISAGGGSFGGTARFNQTGGSVTAGDVSFLVNATAGRSATEAGSSGASIGGDAFLVQTGGAFSVTGDLSLEARGYVFGGSGNQLAQTGGSAGIGVLAGTFNVDGEVSIDASAGAASFASGTTPPLAIIGGSTSLDANNAASVTLGSLSLYSSATGGIDFGGNDGSVGAPAMGGISALRVAGGATVTVDGAFLIDASGTGGFAAQGGTGTGGTIDLALTGGALELGGSAQLNAGGVSGVSFGTIGSTSAFGGNITVTVSDDESSALTFNSLAVAATAESGQLITPAARGGPAPVVASNAVGGSVTMRIDGGTVTGSQLAISADGFGSNGGSGTGGSVDFIQTGGTVQVAGVGLSSDGFGGTSAPGIEDGDGPVVGGIGRGGVTSVTLTGGSITTSFFSASAGGTGGSGFTVFASNGEGGPGNGEGGLLLPGDGGDGFGGSLEVLIDGTASAGLGSAFFSAFGRGGGGGDFITDGDSPVYTPGRGGNGTGGDVFVDVASGEVSGALFASARAIGGDGGRVFDFANETVDFAGSSADASPIGGDAVGGSAEIRVATTVSASLSADATAGAGEGGTALSGARGGDALGGFARILVDDGVDVGSIDVSISAAGFGGRGGRAIHGNGGNGGDGAGGTAAFDIANGGAANVLNSDVDVRGVGGDGRNATIDPGFAPVVNGFSGGDGGSGTGGTIAIGVIDADLILSAGNGEGIFLASTGFGGFGGDGADNSSGDPSIATFGGSGGRGGDGIGGTINLSAAGGTLSSDNFETVQITVGGEGGEGGFGGSGNVTSMVDPVTEVTTFAGGNGSDGFSGFRLGGLARIEAHDTENGAGLIDIPSLSIDASGDFGGRVELIDDSAGTGIALSGLSISTAGGSFIGGDFSQSGSGVYISSRDGAITVDNSLFLAIDGAFQIDAFDTGGFDVAGDFDLAASFDITARHFDRGDNATISAQSIDFTGNNILFEGGTLVAARSGNLTLDAIGSVYFGRLSAKTGSILLNAGLDIVGDEAEADGEIVGNAEGDIRANSLTTTGFGSGGQTSSAPVAGNVRLSAGGDVVLGVVDAADDIIISATNLLSSGGGESATAMSSLVAGGTIDINVSNDARFGSADAAFVYVLAGDTIDFGAINARNGVVVGAGFDIGGGSIDTGGNLAASSAEGNIVVGSTTADNDANFSAAGSIELGSLATRFGSATVAAGNAVRVDQASIGRDFTADSGGDSRIGILISGGSSSVDAGGDIVVTSLTTTGFGGSQTSSAPSAANIRLSADGDVLLGSVDAAGSIFIDAANLIQQPSGSESPFQPSSLAAANAIMIDTGGDSLFGTAEAASIAVVAGGDVRFASTSSALDTSIQAGAAIAGGSIGTDDGDATLRAGTSLRLDEANIGDTLSLTAGAGGVVLGSSISGYDTVIVSGGDVAIMSAITTDIGATAPTSSADIVIDAVGAVTIGRLDSAEDVRISAGSVSGATGSIVAAELIQVITARQSALGALDGGFVSISSGEGLDFDTIVSRNGVDLFAQFDISGGSIDTGGSLSVASAEGGIAIGQTRSDFDSEFDAATDIAVTDLTTSFGNATLAAGGSIGIDLGNVGSALSASSGGDTTIGDVTVGRSATIGAGGAIAVTRLVTTGLGGSQSSSAPSAANIVLTAGGDVTLDTLDAADNIFVSADTLRQQAGGESGGASSLTAGGDIAIDTVASADFGSANGDFVDVDAGGDIDFTSISARGGVRLTADFDIIGDAIATGGQLTATSAEGNIDIDTSSAGGNIAFTAAEGNVLGDFAESRFGTITIRALSVDFGELYAAGNIDIAADEDVTLDYAETGGEGGSFDTERPSGKNALAGTSCEDCIGASDGDILIAAGDTLALGTLDAFDDIVITAGTLTGTTSTLAAGDTLTATIEGNAQFGTLLSSGNMALTAGGNATGQSAETTGSGSRLALSATQGLSVGSVRAAGTADLAASAGGVAVANLLAVGLVNASGQSVSVAGGTGLLDFQTLRATAGDARVTVGSGDLVVRSGSATGTLALSTQNGAIETRGVQGRTVSIDSSRGATLNNATTATGELGITARNTAMINGIASGGTVRITSGDIVIASGGRVGTAGTTTEVLLINGDGTRRTFVGGTGSTAGYSLAADEMTRLFGSNITIRAPRVSASSSGTAAAPGTAIIAPTGEPDLVIDAFSLSGGGGTGGNLGSSGILRIETPGFARVVGAAQVTNASAGNSFVVAANRSLQVILGSGSLRIANGSALAGTLRLISEDVVVATSSAIADIAVAADLAAIDERLSQNDGIISDEGALSGGTLRFEISRGLYVQNSGDGDKFADRRGFTAGSGGVAIFTGEGSSTTGGGAVRLVINGRTTGDTGEFLTGTDAFTRISVNQLSLTGESQIVNGLDAGSTINGCLIVSASSCFDFEVDLIPPIQDNPLVDRDDEESELTGGDDSLSVTTIVEIKDVDRMSNEPVVDEPVTGSGNDDLWSPPEDDEEDD